MIASLSLSQGALSRYSFVVSLSWVFVAMQPIGNPRVWGCWPKELGHQLDRVQNKSLGPQNGLGSASFGLVALRQLGSPHLSETPIG